MTSKAGHTFTAGPCEFHTQPYDCRSGNGLDHSIMGDDGVVVFVTPPGPANETFQKRGHLIAEAFNVAHETGLTPRQLVDAYSALRDGSKTAVEAWKAERAELLAALRSIEAALRKDSRDKTVCSETVEYHLDGQAMFAAINQARAAIAKATAGGAV